ncbi:zinc finger CW-type PWWP domain protein 2 isoform X3 [Alligator mississippiensis]|uniref:zinc finger CW-type PWWP domain protein 2 isoform X3 n=1 Tax=Alligator mississippiensis TaxID=8496 RepID=UPI0009076B0C|nr:zinc finger CW-type PWWP domain protein 2 isoform X3 [Alligator mississippiensis]
MSPALRGGGQPNPASRPPSAGQARRGRWLSRRHCQVPQNDPVCTIEYNSPTKFDFWRTRKNEDFAMDSVNENSFYLNKIWVQCENGSCLKWRLLSTDAAAQVDHNEPWYCYMNTDPWFNKCSVSEECFPEESEFHKNGFKYIYSELSIGSLVLVKLCNSPRWPGIICPDPVNGQHVTHDLDGYVDSNHVEYLGDPHSRGWVAVKHISRYSTSVKPERCRRQKKWYKRALEEANKLLACSSEQRLGHLSSKGGKTDASNDTELSKRRNKQVGKRSTCGIGQKKKKKMLRCSLETIGSDDILSKDNLVCRTSWTRPESAEGTAWSHCRTIGEVVSQTEIILKDLERILRHVADPSITACDSYVDGKEKDIGEKVTKSNTEVTEGSPAESYCQEDCVVIDGIAFRVVDCIENITNKFKEIDSLMAEFQNV